MKNDFEFIRLSIITVVFCLTVIGCTQKNRDAQIIKLGMEMESSKEVESEPNVVNKTTYIDGKIIEGKWELASDPTAYFVFYANTWRFVDNDNWVDMGLFFLDEDYLTLKSENGSDRIKYNRDNNILIFSEHTQEWVNARWNKVVRQDNSGLHPLIGTWKGELENGRILLFQYFTFDPESKLGTGLHYSYDSTFSEIRVCYAAFVEDKNSKLITSQPVTATLLDDGVKEQEIRLELNDDGELVRKIRIADIYEIINGDLIMKNRGDLVCKKI